jgi:hypothetical protein
MGRTNRKQRRTQAAVHRQKHNLPFVSSKAKKLMMTSEKHYDKARKDGDMVMNKYKHRILGMENSIQLVFVNDGAKNHAVVVLDSMCRMHSEEVKATLKCNFSDKDTLNDFRNSDSLGLGRASFFVRWDSVNGPIVAIVIRDSMDDSLASASLILEREHNRVSKGWNKGCEADPWASSHNILSQVKNPLAMKSAGFCLSNVCKVLSVGPDNPSKSTSPKFKYINVKEGRVVSRPLCAFIDRHKWSSNNSSISPLRTLAGITHEEQDLVSSYLDRRIELFQHYLPQYLGSRGWSMKHTIEAVEWSSEPNIVHSTLKTLRNKIPGNHRDPPTPTFACVGGHGNFELKDGVFVRKQLGGNLYLVDGLLRLDYGPRDMIFLDGNVAHGVTNMRHMTQKKGNLSRFSVISFSNWRREKMKKPGNYDGYYNCKL